MNTRSARLVVASLLLTLAGAVVAADVTTTKADDKLAPARARIAEAEKFYTEALRIEPKHRGALEYSGELYLMTGKLDMAEQRLAALDKACFLPCEEYSDLKRAVARYKAAGNKYVP